MHVKQLFNSLPEETSRAAPASSGPGGPLEACQNEIESLRAQLAAAHCGTRAYSWEGEDILASKILHDRFGVASGFYVDVGAHHPVNLSNTFLLYQRGWRGINIDAMPGSMEAFRQIRPGDVNLELGIARESSPRTFVQFDDPGINGFLTDDEAALQTGRGRKVVARSTIQCAPLTAVLDRYQVKRDFDLLNVDVEGLDLEVLLSIDFERYRPKLIVAEVLGCNEFEDVLANPITLAMKDRGYKLFSRLDFSVIFLDSGGGS
jgi:FkbM family methyltransferase